MEAVELAIPAAVDVPKLMGSEVLVGAIRVCTGTDAEACESNAVNDECNSLANDRGTGSAAESSFRSKKAVSGLTIENKSLGLNHGITNNGTVLMVGSEGRQIQRKVGKSPRNGSGSFKKPRILQTDNLLHQVEGDDSKMGLDMVGSNLIKCSNQDKSQAIKQKSNINGRRGDRRNSRFQLKTKNDPFWVPNFSPASGGSNTFGFYGLKPEVHNINNLLEDLSLDQLLDGTYKCPTQGQNERKKPANVNENLLCFVRKACSILRLPRIQQDKQAEELDNLLNQKISLSSPPNTNMVNGSDGEESSITSSSSKFSKDLVSSNKAGAPANMNNRLSYQPREMMERLALPPVKDLDSLLQDAVKAAGSIRPTDSRSAKSLSHRVSLLAFPWSHNFNGHCKSNNDATKNLSKSTCQGKWARVKNTASFNREGRTEDFLDFESLTYDGNLVPIGQVKYRLPDSEKSLSAIFNQPDKLSAMVSTLSHPPHESGSILDNKMNAVVAAQTLCAMRAHSNGMLKWPKQPSQKAMKARKSRFNEKPEEGLLIPKSEPTLDHVHRNIEYGTFSKKSKLSVVERREEFSHTITHTVIGLCSVSAPRSNTSSPNRFSKDSSAETRHINENLTKPSFVGPPPSRVLDRGNHNPQKPRKIGTMEWSRGRSQL